MIELRNLTKWYRTPVGRHYVFKELNAIFPPDKSIGLIGTNGAGKSTLLRMIGGSDYPNSGKIVTDKKISWPVGLGGGFQGSLSARDNIKFVCRIHGLDHEQIREKIEFVQEFAEISEYFDMPIKSYSSGMAARVSFGLSMAFDFDYYLVDEATSVGDKNFTEKSNKLFREKCEKANIIMVSHNLEQLVELTDIGMVLNKGEVRFFETTQEAVDYYTKFI